MSTARRCTAPSQCLAAGVQAWLEAWFSATGAALAATPIVITELTVDADATSPPEQAAPGVFLARLGPQQRLHPRRLGEGPRPAASPPSAGRRTVLLPQPQTGR